jgi:protein tyrosine/serine phosphatase
LSTAVVAFRSGPRKALLIGALAVAVLAGIGGSLWGLVLRERFVPKQFGVVVPGAVYRSGQISLYLIANVIDRYHIGTIIDLNGLEPRFAAHQEAEMAAAKAHGAAHYRFPLRGDGTGQIERFADAVETLVESERRGVPVLVHCAAGTNRTGTCVSFYRLLVRQDPPAQVYHELVAYGSDPRLDHEPLEYINSHLKQMAELLVQRHVLDRVPETTPVLHP